MPGKKDISFYTLRFQNRRKKVSLSPSGFIISDPTIFTNTNEFVDVIEKFATWETASSSVTPLRSKKKNKSQTGSAPLKSRKASEPHKKVI